jgi:V/A-type H+-transporting ATPase subunit K
VKKFAFIAAALAFGFGAVGAGIAVGNVGSAAMGAIGEKPEIAGQAIIFVALAEGLAVFGLIIAILILGRV